MKTYFKDAAYLLLFLLTSIVCVGTLSFAYFLFVWFFEASPFEMLHDHFYYTEMPKIKAMTNGYEVVIMVKLPFKLWREAYNGEYFYDMSKGIGSPAFMSSKTVQEIAIERMGMVKKHFERRNFQDMELISQQNIYKALTEVDDE
jgi:hypothetical protein